MKKQYQDSASLALHQIFLVAVVLTIVSASLLALLYHLLPHPSLMDVSLIISKYQGGLQPKPQERFVFLILATMVPMLTFLTAITVFRRINKQPNELRSRMIPSPLWDEFSIACVKEKLSDWSKIPLPVIFLALRKSLTVKGARDNLLWCSAFLTQNKTGVLIFATAAILYFPFVGYDFSQALLTQARLPSEHPMLILALTLLVAAVWYVWQFSRVHYALFRRPHRVSVVVSWLIFGTAVLLQTGAWRVLGEFSITQADRWFGHADAVFYAVGQVMGGKTLLVDLPSQYGLYPELLAPIFKVIGFSIFHFIALCAALQVLSLTAIYWVVHRSIRDNAIRISCALALIMVTFGTVVWLIGLGDPYYQYWPIRFVCPAIAVFLFYRYSRLPTAWRALQVSLMGAIGALWNMDSGLMIVIAFAGVLVLKWIVLWSVGSRAYVLERRQLRNAMIVHLGTFVTVVLLMFGYLFLKGGGPLHWDWLFGYQKIFYGLGFMMQPMPHYPYPWMSILGIYLMALLVAARSWSFNPRAKNADLLSFISMLGLGLFIYYEGRSHHLNLITVSWPAIVLIAMLADRVLRAVRTGLLSRQHLLLPIAALSVLLFCSIPLVLASVKLGQSAIAVFESRNIPADEWVSDELRFIRQHSKPGDECVMLCRRQGLYYAATGMSSPISGPGFVETILQRDRDAFLDKLTQKRYACIFVGIAPSSALDLGVDPMKILHGYEVVAENSHHSLLFLRDAHRS